MLHVKSCKVQQNSESIFRYFATAVNSNYKVQNVIEKIFMLSVIIQALKIPLCSSVHLLQSLFDIQWLGFSSLLG